MTKRKLSLIIVAAILAAILLAAAVCVIIANSRNDNSKPTDELASWMSMIKDDALLKMIAIPGAHDAGTKGMPYFAATQDRDIADLLNCGTRYLDLRVSYANGKLLIYHGPCKGVALADVLDTVKQFLTDHPSETVLLDFQHFEEVDHEAQDATLKLLIEKLAKSNMLVACENGFTNPSNAEFMNKLTLKHARGKAIAFWGRQYEKATNSYPFLRDDDNGNRDSCSLHSYYDSSLHKKSSSAFIKTALPKYLERWKNCGVWKNNEGLFVLQGQLTDGMFIFGPKLREATHTDNMNRYVEELRSSEYIDIVNIIMRDFVTPHKNCLTLRLNAAKVLVKEDCRQVYEKMLQDNSK